jgi:hypothetical protein
LLHPGPFGYPAGQQHERGTVVDEIPRHARGGQCLLQDPFVRAGRADDDPAHLIVDPAAVELGEEPDRHRWALVADHGRAGVIEHGAVLGDDGVEQLEAVADPCELEEGPPRDQDETKARLPGLLQRLPDRWRDPVLRREGAVVVAGERLEEHVRSLRASRVPSIKRHRMRRIAGAAVVTRDTGAPLSRAFRPLKSMGGAEVTP